MTGLTGCNMARAVIGQFYKRLESAIDRMAVLSRQTGYKLKYGAIKVNGGYMVVGYDQIRKCWPKLLPLEPKITRKIGNRNEFILIEN